MSRGYNGILDQVDTIIKKQVYEEVKKMMGGEDAGILTAEQRRSMCNIVCKLTQFQQLNAYRGSRGALFCDFSIREDGEYYYMTPDDTDKWDYKPLYDIGGVEDFRYWNNTDRPEGVSAEEWRVRGEVWEKVWVPGRAALWYSVIDYVNPVHDLLMFFSPVWASRSEMEKYGLPTCYENAQKREKEKP